VFLANEMDSESQVCFAEAERREGGNPRWPYFQAVVLVNHGEREAALPFLQHSVELCEAAELDNVVPQLVLAEMLLGRSVMSRLRPVSEDKPVVKQDRATTP
jgi:hypothetical protein